MMNLYSATITLILVMDPLGNVPFFISVLKHVPAAKRRLIILRESCIAFFVLLIFLLFGQRILHGMNISQPALAIAGGIILFLIAIRMIFPQDEHNKDKLMSEPFIVPLAIPLIAGPSTMTMVMVLANQAPEAINRWLVALFLSWLITTSILVCSDFLRKCLGERGLHALERLMGMVLTTMAVQMFLTGIAEFLKNM